MKLRYQQSISSSSSLLSTRCCEAAPSTTFPLPTIVGPGTAAVVALPADVDDDADAGMAYIAVAELFGGISFNVT